MFHHGDSSTLLSSRTAFLPERHVFIQGGTTAGDSGLVLSTDAKPRLKWTKELHERFIQAVNQLGGPDKATPKTIMNLMGIPGLTLYHLKSHLQKYRLSKNLQGQANTGTNKKGFSPTYDTTNEESVPLLSNLSCGSQPNKNIQISEALQLQIEVQQRLHEQLEVQRHLQLRIEAQGKYLQCVLEKAKETLDKQNASSPDLDNAKVHLSQLVSKVSDERLNTILPHFQEVCNLFSLQEHTNQVVDYSAESCLTSSDGSQKDHDLPNLRIELNTHSRFPSLHSHMGEELQFHQNQTRFNGSKSFALSTTENSSRAVSPVLSMSVMPLTEDKRGAASGRRSKYRDEGNYLLHESSKHLAIQHEKEEEIDRSRSLCFTASFDLNAHDEGTTSKRTKKLDLNWV